MKFFFEFCKSKKILVFVNYPRSYSSLLNKLSKIINKKENEYKSIDIIYNKGFYNSCSHYINFLFNLFNTKKFKNISLKKKKRFKKDFLIDCDVEIKVPIRFISTGNNVKEKIIFMEKNLK